MRQGFKDLGKRLRTASQMVKANPCDKASKDSIKFLVRGNFLSLSNKWLTFCMFQHKSANYKQRFLMQANNINEDVKEENHYKTCEKFVSF